MIDSTALIIPERQNQFDEVGIEPGLKIEPMMLIDTHNFTDNLVCFILSFVIMLITIVTACTGPQQYRTSSQIYPIIMSEITRKIESSLGNLTPLNRFVTLLIDFRRNDISTELIAPINISFSIVAQETLLGSPSVVFQSKEKEYLMKFEKSCIESEHISLYFDKMMHYKEYQATIAVAGKNLPDLSYIELHWNFGDSTITWVVIIVRSIYLAIIVALFIMYTRLTCKKKFIIWTTEQKLTYFLLFFCIFADYPLFEVNLARTSLSIITLTSILETLFKMFVPFFVISIYQTVKCQSVPLDFPIKIISGTIFFLIMIIDVGATLMCCIDTFRTQLLQKSSEIKQISDICECAVSIVVLIVIIKTSLTIDETEFFRFIVYSAHSFMMFVVTLPVKMVRMKTEYSCLPMLIELTGYNLYVIVMAYFHWPYKVKTDTSYQDSSIQEPKHDIMLDKVSDSDQSTSTEITSDTGLVSEKVCDENEQEPVSSVP